MVVLGCLAAIPAMAQSATDYRAEVNFWLQDAETKLVGLAQAMPQEKYTWRPGEGVRSVSEVFMHVAGGNYMIPRMIGAPPSTSFTREMQTWTDKAKVIEALQQSFAYVRQAVSAVPDADLDKPLKVFGRDSTYRGAMMLLATHAHEHLGQAIAYARSNSVVPPWTAEAEARRAAQPAKQPAKQPQ